MACKGENELSNGTLIGLFGPRRRRREARRPVRRAGTARNVGRYETIADKLQIRVALTLNIRQARRSLSPIA